MATAGIDDHKWFEVLVREHHHRILAYTMSLGVEREIARDLVQDAFLVAYEKRNSFDPTCNFGAWVRGIVRHKYLHWIAKRRETPLDPALIGELDLVYTEWDNSALDQNGQFEQLRRCVASLPDSFQQVVREFYFNSSSCKYIAELIDVEILTIRKRLQRARELLAVCLQRALVESK